MGLFGTREEVELLVPDVIEIPTSISDQLTDAGEFFVSWASSSLYEEQAQQIRDLVTARRAANGWIARDSLSDIGVYDFKNGPLTFLVQMTVRDTIVLQVWASFGLKGENKRSIESAVASIFGREGHAAAATWAIGARPSKSLSIDFLNESLTGAWTESLASVTNGDFSKSFRKWKH
ncbi:hypothetical protein B0G38_004583 [Arthrobacter sp. VKM Ac-2550]|nr:hypothetical protein [Arthrobacter sp. VKM Ac-2550]